MGNYYIKMISVMLVDHLKPCRFKDNCHNDGYVLIFFAIIFSFLHCKQSDSFEFKASGNYEHNDVINIEKVNEVCLSLQSKY